MLIILKRNEKSIGSSVLKLYTESKIIDIYLKSKRKFRKPVLAKIIFFGCYIEKTKNLNTFAETILLN